VQHGGAHRLLVRMVHPDPCWSRDALCVPTWRANYRGLIPPASKCWYVCASDPDGWA
jgi:hypothetical protein